MPKIKSLIFLLLGIGLVVALYFFANLFSLFFCSVIVFCSLFFLGVIISEKNIDGEGFRKRFPKLETTALNVKRLQAYRFTTTLLGISLLTIIYLISVFVIKKFQQPDEAKSYFNNADHHALSNTGVAFNQTREFLRVIFCVLSQCSPEFYCLPSLRFAPPSGFRGRSGNSV